MLAHSIKMAFLSIIFSKLPAQLMAMSLSESLLALAGAGKNHKNKFSAYLKLFLQLIICIATFSLLDIVTYSQSNLSIWWQGEICFVIIL